MNTYDNSPICLLGRKTHNDVNCAEHLHNQAYDVKLESEGLFHTNIVSQPSAFITTIYRNATQHFIVQLESEGLLHTNIVLQPFAFITKIYRNATSV